MDQPWNIPSPTPDLQLNQRFVSIPAFNADNDWNCLAVQSGVGTGKTKRMVEAAACARSALYIVPRERLAENFSREALKYGVAVENYKELSKADRRRPQRMAFCVNSYSVLADEAPGLTVPELLELDEIEQLIEHIYGEAGTFKGREAIDAAEALKHVIRGSRYVLAMDAHLSSLALDYLRAQGRSVRHEVNTYVTPHGPMTIHGRREGALSKGKLLVSQDQGVVVFAVASAEFAKVVAADLVELVGNPHDVLLLIAEYGGGERQRAFFADPNGQIGQYRAVIYSPVIGTGFDITIPVRAVIGIMADHLSAYDARQMIGRCRATRETHVFLPTTSATREENPAMIEAQELAKAKNLIKTLTEEGVRVSAGVDEAQCDYLKWHAQVMARRNRSINHLQAHFLSLCQGYTITFSNHSDPTLASELKAIEAEMEEKLKETVLVVEPIDEDTYHQLVDAGKADEDTYAAYRRWEIEGVLGAPISPTARDLLWTPEQREQLCNFATLIDDQRELRLAETEAQRDGLPLPKLRKVVDQRVVGNAFMRVLLDDQGEPRTYSKAELDAALAPVIWQYPAELAREFGCRPDRTQSAAAVARRVLKPFGLGLDSEQQRINGEKVRLYHLEKTVYVQQLALGRLRCSMLKRQRDEITAAHYGPHALENPHRLKTADSI